MARPSRSAAHITVDGNAVGSVLMLGDGGTVTNKVTIIYGSTVPKRAPSGPNPYRGLDSFDETSSDLFFGREDIIRQLSKRLLGLAASDPSTRPRVLGLLGPSGSGKTSLLRAGLLPAIARSDSVGLRLAQVVILRPGYHPMQALADAIARLQTKSATAPSEQKAILDELDVAVAGKTFDGLTRSLLRLGSDTPFVIIVDQFEETYTLSRATSADTPETSARKRNARNALVETLLHAARSPNVRCTVVISCRTDFLGSLTEHPELSAAISNSHEIVPPMVASELKRAIAEPARKSGLPIDDATVEDILVQAQDEIAPLPLVQFALEQIWNAMRTGADPGPTLRAIGGVGGALARRANELLELAPSNNIVVENAILAAIQLGDSSSRDTRRRVWLDEVVPDGSTIEFVRAALEPFVEERLIIMGGEEEGRVWFELAHESLIRNWKVLQDWIDVRRDDLRFRARLQAAAANWQADGRRGGTLWRSSDLELLERFVLRNAGALTTLQKEYFAAAKRRRTLIRGGLIGAAAVGAILLVVALIMADRANSEAQGLLAANLNLGTTLKRLDTTIQQLTEANKKLEEDAAENAAREGVEKAKAAIVALGATLSQDASGTFSLTYPGGPENFKAIVGEIDALGNGVSIDLTYGSQVTELDALEGVHDRIIGLKVEPYGIISLEPLSKLKNLTDLEIPSGRIETLEPLRNLTSLQTLSVAGNFADLSPLSGLINLRSLNLNTETGFGGPFVHVDALAGMTKMQNLTVTGSAGMEDVTFLRGMNDIETLLIPFAKVIDMNQLVGKTKLKQIDLETDDAGAAILGDLPNLEVVSLDDSSLTSVKWIAKLAKLQRLNVSSNNLTTLEGFGGHPDLSDVDLSSNPHLSDLHKLIEEPAIQTLAIQGTAVRDISPLAELPNLRSLFVGKETKITTLKPLAGRQISFIDAPPDLEKTAQ